MKEEVTGGDDTAGPGRKRPTLGIGATNVGMRQNAAVDRHAGVDGNMLAGQGNHRLDERAQPARAKAPPDVTALESLREGSVFRRADEDEIPGGYRAVQRDNLPKPERIARCQIQTKPETVECGEHQDWHDDRRQHDDVTPQLNYHFSTCDWRCV